MHAIGKAKRSSPMQEIDKERMQMSNIRISPKERFICEEDILEGVAEYFRVPIERLRGSRRDYMSLAIKAIAAVMMRRMCAASFPRIAEVMQFETHPTAMHACHRFCNMRDSIGVYTPNGQMEAEDCVVRIAAKIEADGMRRGVRLVSRYPVTDAKVRSAAQ